MTAVVGLGAEVGDDIFSYHVRTTVRVVVRGQMCLPPPCYIEPYGGQSLSLCDHTTTDTRHNDQAQNDRCLQKAPTTSPQ